eukprot:GDKJ01048421.1.p1 GENE.GDKJ01048421.1~~GDKJ01048421.1.p1  ORF type:complete len:726 (-),score=152.58 GDKJ01048421.1:29-2095(-)
MNTKENNFIERLDYAKTRSQMVYLTKTASRDTITRAHYMDLLSNVKSSADREYTILYNDFKLKAREEQHAKSRLMLQKEEYENIISQKDDEICELRAKVELLKGKVHLYSTHVEAAEVKLQKYSDLQNVLTTMMDILDLSSPEDLARRVKTLEATELRMLHQIDSIEQSKQSAENQLHVVKRESALRNRELEEKLASSQRDVESLTRACVVTRESQDSELMALRLIKDRHLTLCSYVAALWHYWRVHVDWGVIRNSPVILLQDLRWKLIVNFGSVRDAWDSKHVPKFSRVNRSQFQAHMAKLDVAPYESASLFDFFLNGGGGRVAESFSKISGPPINMLMKGGLGSLPPAEQDALAAAAQEEEVRQLVVKAEQAMKERAASIEDSEVGEMKISVKNVRTKVIEIEQLASKEGGTNGAGATIQMNIVFNAMEQGVNYGPLHGLREKPAAQPVEVVYESVQPDSSEPLLVLQAVQQLLILSHPGRGVAQLHEITQLTNSLYRCHFPESSQSNITNGLKKSFKPTEILKSVCEVMRLRQDQCERAKNDAKALKSKLSLIALKESKAQRALKVANERSDFLAKRIAALSGLSRGQVAESLLANDAPLSSELSPSLNPNSTNAAAFAKSTPIRRPLSASASTMTIPKLEASTSRTSLKKISDFASRPQSAIGRNHQQQLQLSPSVQSAIFRKP